MFDKLRLWPDGGAQWKINKAITVDPLGTMDVCPPSFSAILNCQHISTKWNHLVAVEGRSGAFQVCGILEVNSDDQLLWNNILKGLWQYVANEWSSSNCYKSLLHGDFRKHQSRIHLLGSVKVFTKYHGDPFIVDEICLSGSKWRSNRSTSPSLEPCG